MSLEPLPNAIDYLPNEYLRERCAQWVTPRANEKPSDTLQRAYRAARAAGLKLYGHSLYNAWTRARCAEGNPPSALRRDAGTILERFWARVIPGPDEHLFWDGSRDEGRPLFKITYREGDAEGLPPGLVRGEAGQLYARAQRFAWQLRHGVIPTSVAVWATCGSRDCLNVEHLAAAPRPGRRRVGDRRLLEWLRACAAQLGYTPTHGEYDAWRDRKTMYTSDAIRRRFGSWLNAITAAGLKPRGVMKTGGRFVTLYEPAEMLVKLQQLAADLGRVPTGGDWERSGLEPHRTSVRRAFGGWAGAVKAAGLR